MFLQYQIDLTTALRPTLLPEETLLFVQDAVGLYSAKLKLPEYQNGQAYLTSHRVCYVDQKEPRQKNLAINLRDVERHEFYARFLKSSPKITLYPKPIKNQSRGPPTASSNDPATSTTPAPTPVLSVNATWVCPICSFSNPVPSNFDPAIANARTPIPPCLACGIKPPLVHVVKAAITAISNRQPSELPPKYEDNGGTSSKSAPGAVGSNTLSCPRCTFQNHPSLTTCEICGSSLASITDKRLDMAQGITRIESPGPSLNSPLKDEVIECIKFSFRGGGEKIFYERLKNALVQRKWLLQSAPPIPKPRAASGITGDGLSDAADADSPDLGRNKVVGIAGLERRDLEQRKNTEAMIGSSFEDLEALMTSAKEIIALAEQFASQANLGTNSSSEASALASQSASALGLVTTKDMLGSGSESLYVSELSRNLAEWLTDDTHGILKKEGGIMTLVDLWAVFNRARGGVELVSPTDFEKAARMWDKLKLPVRLRQFKSGLLVVQGRNRTDVKTIESLVSWLGSLHAEPPSPDTAWDWQKFGRGVTAQETAEWFGWSVGVATEELEMAEEAGALCREQGLDGVRFWENWFTKIPNVATDT
ncbi:Vps36-domain-containing protein [Periconia macrospinosa]|uniref:Vacuolar protein-sorting-associated protein 36 n=1 Tax=Periconia macrospinosa TaxID=97972 RepID=A0A2V1E6Q0_9PLEO|nr:Vps36-domain-containing protein [Periconia macrospinosa]